MRTVFVTVGTTQFESLVDVLLSDEILGLLAKHGYKRLVMQLGRGPEPTVPASLPLKVEWYRFKPSLDEDMQGAELIVSHAGAGSILEGMRLGKLMIVVVNDALMHNHQQELAEELESRRHLLSTTPGGLAATLRELAERPPELAPLPAADPTLFPAFLSTALGVAP